VDYRHDENFRYAQDRLFEYSVLRATEETYFQTAWRPEGEVYAALASSLDRRGIDPDPDAVRAAAELISRGRRPSVLRRHEAG
jgi:hypothetical protein